jgi:hypothetical protein
MTTNDMTLFVQEEPFLAYVTRDLTNIEANYGDPIPFISAGTPIIIDTANTNCITKFLSPFHAADE